MSLVKQKKIEAPEYSPRPKTKAAAVLLVQAVYLDNDWDGDTQARYEANLGLDPKPLTERDNAELKTILNDFENARMILFRQVTNGA